MGSLAVTAARFRVQPVVIRAGTPWAFALAAGLVVIFGCHVGVVKYFTAAAIKKIADQLEVARKRAPGKGLDLSMLNVANPQDIFRKKEI